MLQDRGDDVSEFVEHADAVVRPRYYSEIIILDTDKTTVFVALKKELVKELTKEFKDYEDADDFIGAYKSKNYILVVGDAPSSPTMNTFHSRDKQLSAQGGMFQVYLKAELMYNPSKHELVPKHEKLTPEETEALKEQYQIKSKTLLPHIHRNDVMARWLGLRHGDIVRITRHNDTSGEYYFYRYCV